MAEKPLIAISACLLGQKVRYDGDHRHLTWLDENLLHRIRVLPLCPEMDIGLGVPRPTIALRRFEDGLIRLERTSDDHDLTETMQAYCHGKVNELASLGVQGCILKARSPSCGMRDVKVFEGRTAENPRAEGVGYLVQALRQQLPECPVIDEEGLLDTRMRQAFLAKIL